MSKENNVLADSEIISSERLLIGLRNKSNGDKIAVTEEQYKLLDMSTFDVDGIILRDDDEMDLMISKDEDTRCFSFEGKDDIPEDDKSRKKFIPPVMSELNGAELTDYLLDNHPHKYDRDGCAICYCKDYGDGYFMPSGGELSAIFSHKEDVDSLMGLINATALNGKKYWVSTQFSEDYSWHYDVEQGFFAFWLSKKNVISVRPIKDASEYIEMVNPEID